MARRRLIAEPPAMPAKMRGGLQQRSTSFHPPRSKSSALASWNRSECLASKSIVRERERKLPQLSLRNSGRVTEEASDDDQEWSTLRKKRGRASPPRATPTFRRSIGAGPHALSNSTTSGNGLASGGTLFHPSSQTSIAATSVPTVRTFTNRGNVQYGAKMDETGPAAVHHTEIRAPSAPRRTLTGGNPVEITARTTQPLRLTQLQRQFKGPPFLLDIRQQPDTPLRPTVACTRPTLGSRCTDPRTTTREGGRDCVKSSGPSDHTAGKLPQIPVHD